MKAFEDVALAPAPPKVMIRLNMSSPFPDLESLIDLVSLLLVYAPDRRMTARQACGHALFNAIKKQGAQLPNGSIIAKTIDFNRD